MKRSTIYAINKMNRSAIVYRNANGTYTRLTREDFASEEEFEKWKRWSDEDLHEWEKLRHRHERHTVGADILPFLGGREFDPERILFARIGREEKAREVSETVARVKDLLTEKQFRRLWKYCAEGMKQHEIAESEGVTQTNVSRSVITAKRKILKSIAQPPKTGE